MRKEIVFITSAFILSVPALLYIASIDWAYALLVMAGLVVVGMAFKEGENIKHREANIEYSQLPECKQVKWHVYFDNQGILRRVPRRKS